MGIFIADTEKRSEVSKDIDKLAIIDMLRVINEEDQGVALAVRAELPHIAKAVEQAEKTLRAGGSIFYIGAGTSGRLGVLDASECPPTYGVPAGMFVGIIAGGDGALRNSVEGAEDDEALAVRDLEAKGFTGNDFLIGLAASGRTPYVLGALAHARGLGAATALVACSKRLPGAVPADIVIAVDTGPEVVTGSTRMKAGTAQKMVLNMISTSSMIRLGKVYGNLMVDLRPSNEKLVDRARRIIVEATGMPYERAAEVLERSGNDVKTAIAMAELGVERQAAERLLAESGGLLNKALERGRTAPAESMAAAR